MVHKQQLGYNDVWKQHNPLAVYNIVSYVVAKIMNLTVKIGSCIVKRGCQFANWMLVSVHLVVY